MYYNNEWIRKNICVIDSYDMDIDIISGDNCFIIGHHMNDKYTLEKMSGKLLDSGYTYFNIFGQQSNLWSESIISINNTSSNIKIQASRVDNNRMVYELAMLAYFNPNSINYVISDDEYFTEYLIEDLQDILNGRDNFTVYDWKKFREGFEFTYNNKDAIISISSKIIIGFLGKEKYFNSIDKAFISKIFDGKNFIEIWNDLKDK